jgi:hypothetical protein
MKQETIILIIRSAFTMWLCHAVYGETGPFTAFSFFLIFVMCEFITAYIRKANKLAGLAVRKLGL